MVWKYRNRRQNINSGSLEVEDTMSSQFWIFIAKNSLQEEIVYGLKI